MIPSWKNCDLIVVLLANMKNLFRVFIAFISCVVINAGIKEGEAMGALEGMLGKCEPKPTEENLKDIIWNKADVSKSTKCTRLCLLDLMEMLTEDCKLNEEKCVEMLSMGFQNKEEEAPALIKACNTKVKCENRCEGAHDYSMCMLNEMKERKWEIPEIEKDN